MTSRQPVWDLPVRLLHLVLLLGSAGAWLTAGDAERADLHLLLGWLVAGAVVARLVWAVIGTRHARWSALARPPRVVWAHLVGLVRGTAPRSVGHNPVAAWAALAALGILLVLTATGLVTWLGEEQPFASGVSVATGLGAHALHEGAAWALVAWLVAHLAGVLKESLRTRENLPAGMITGYKRGGITDAVPARAGVGAGIVLAVAGFAGAWLLPAEPPRVTAEADPQLAAECGSCHLVFDPSLLPARSWERMLVEQDRHFGEDLLLDASTVEVLRARLVAGAAEAGRTEHAARIAASVPAGEAPQRVTELSWWADVHADLAPEVYRREDVGGRARCEACHADVIDFVDGTMSVPPPSGGAS